MLPIKEAVKLPIIISRNVRFYNLSGNIKLIKPVKFSMIRFGFFGDDNMYWNSKKTLLKIEGKLCLHQNIKFANGIILRVEKNAQLTIDENVYISNDVKIICYENIQIGKNTRIAWDCQIIDTNFHYIVDKKNPNVRLDLTKPIKIGKNNWIGNRSSLMKGSETPDYCIIASGSLVNRKLDIPQFSMVAGTPVKLVKLNVYRVIGKEENMIRNNE